MSVLSVRELAKDDASYLVEVCSLAHCRGFVQPPTVEQVRAALGDRHAISYILEAEGHRVGVLRLCDADDPAWLVEVRLLVIAEPRRGYGSAAMAWAQEHGFRARRAHRMYLEVAAHNGPARALYERCGFIQEGVFRDGFRDVDGTFRDLVAYGKLASEFVGDP